MVNTPKNHLNNMMIGTWNCAGVLQHKIDLENLATWAPGGGDHTTRNLFETRSTFQAASIFRKDMVDLKS